MLRLLLLSLLGWTLVSGKAIADPCSDGTYPQGTLFLYTDGCYPYYYECVHGASLQRPCAPGTVFDTAIGVCNHPRDTAACAGGSPTTKSTTTTLAASEGCHGHSHEDLYILDDGCYNYFYQCSHGTAHKMPCAADLVFDTTKNECNYPSEVPACGDGYDTTTTTKRTTTTLSDVGCHGHSHGDLYILDDGCYNYFYQCVHGTAHKMPCAADLVFDTTQQRCNYPSEVPACKSPPDTTTTTTTKLTTAAPSSGGCDGHSHGDLYIPDDGCYNYFYQCVHGTAHKMPCAADLVFDTTQERCNYPSEVTACKSSPDTTTTTTTKLTTATPSSGGCDVHSHGDLYIPDDGCYNYFYQCVHGTAQKMPCAADLVFDTTQQRCNYPSEVPACKSPPDTTTTTTTKQTAAPPSSDGCDGHSHGDLYIPDDGCYNYFYQCVHGTAHKMPCAADLVFDTTKDECNYQSEVPACGDEHEATTTTKQPVAPPSSDGCHDHSHGDLYISDDGCYNYFYQCVHGTAHKMPCAADLVFDTTKDECNYRSEVPACNEGKTYVGFVVDNTGSMLNEIRAVKRWMKRCINGDKLICGNEPTGGWLVASFNDPTAQLEIGPTTDIDEAIATVDGLKPHGGWDCPEMAFLGMKRALDAVPDDNRGCKIFFFTDASPKDYLHLPEVLAKFLKKKCFFIPVLTSCCGKCHTPCDSVSAAFCTDHVTIEAQLRSKRDIDSSKEPLGPIVQNEPSENYYYQLSEQTGGNIYIVNKPNSDTDLLKTLERDVTLGFCDSDKIAGPDGGYKCEADCIAMNMCWDRGVNQCFCGQTCTQSPIPTGFSRCGGSQIFGCSASIPKQIFPDDSDCSGYFVCDYAYLKYRKCSKGTVFNRVLDVCDSPENISEPCGTKESESETLD